MPRPLELTGTISIAVIVGCLPAFKSLIVNRAAARRTRDGYSSAGNRSQLKTNSKLRKTSIPLESFSNEIKGSNGWHPQYTSSQEEMAKSQAARSVTIKREWTVERKWISTRGQTPLSHYANIKRFILNLLNHIDYSWIGYRLWRWWTLWFEP